MKLLSANRNKTNPFPNELICEIVQWARPSQIRSSKSVSSVFDSYVAVRRQKYKVVYYLLNSNINN